MLKNDIDRERAWVVFGALKAMVLARSPVVRGQPVFVAMDQPAWKRERNSLIAKAARIFIETAAVSKDSIVLDWPSGSLYHQCPNVSTRTLGKVNKNAWMWFDAGVKAVNAAIDIVVLKAAMNEE
jgi:hypothetical protein